MRRWGVYGLVALAIAGAAGGVELALRHVSARSGRPFQAPLATPPGVILWSAAKGGRAEEFGAAAAPMFADAQGSTLYASDRTAAGRFACPGDCGKQWRPALAPADAAAAGDWTAVPRTDGALQWAYRGRPLYRYDGDAAPGDAKGNGADGVWHAALFRPETGLTLPVGIGLRELPNGGGEAFVDHGAMTLYVRDGRSDCADLNCFNHWKPASAPEIANQVGDFSVIARQDGLHQWAYIGLPLYRFDGDTEPGDANGAGFDPGFHVALRLRFFMPTEVTVRHAAGLGDILVTTGGMTLYARDRFIDADGHNFRTDHGSEATGRALGVASCDAGCARTWRPLVAPPAAIASGYWDVLTRPDGTRQWAYKGYALYSFAGDHKPGDTNGNESYSLMPLGRDDIHEAALGAGAPRDGAGIGALFWRAATP